MLLIIFLISCITSEVICYTASKPVVSWVSNFPLPGGLALNIQPAVRGDLGSAGSLEKCSPDSVSQHSTLGMSQLLFRPGQGRGWHRGDADRSSSALLDQQQAGIYEIKGKGLSQDSRAQFKGQPSPCLCDHSSGQTGWLNLPWNLHQPWEGSKPCHTQNRASWLQGCTA